ncbi:MAG: hypothetical protein Q9167_005919 [Letrouitia subvulpina]
MALPPVSSFDYKKEPKTWTKKYVTGAFPKGHHNVINELYERATQLILILEHDLIKFSLERNPKKKLREEWTRMAQLLAEEFRESIEVKHHPQFALRLARGVLMYQIGIGTSSPPAQSSSPLPSNVTELTSIQLSLVTLGDFEINFRPASDSFKKLWFKVRVSQLIDPGLPEELENVKFQPLKDLLLRRGLLSREQVRTLTYRTDGSDAAFSIIDDDDLQTAIHHFYRRSNGSMDLVIISAWETVYAELF